MFFTLSQKTGAGRLRTYSEESTYIIRFFAVLSSPFSFKFPSLVEQKTPLYQTGFFGALLIVSAWLAAALAFTGFLPFHK
jgi:hypothetical protein